MVYVLRHDPTHPTLRTYTTRTISRTSNLPPCSDCLSFVDSSVDINPPYLFLMSVLLQRFTFSDTGVFRELQIGSYFSVSSWKFLFTLNLDTLQTHLSRHLDGLTTDPVSFLRPDMSRFPNTSRPHLSYNVHGEKGSS